MDVACAPPHDALHGGRCSMQGITIGRAAVAVGAAAERQRIGLGVQCGGFGGAGGVSAGTGGGARPSIATAAPTRRHRLSLPFARRPSCPFADAAAAPAMLHAAPLRCGLWYSGCQVQSRHMCMRCAALSRQPRSSTIHARCHPSAPGPRRSTAARTAVRRVRRRKSAARCEGQAAAAVPALRPPSTLPRSTPALNATAANQSAPAAARLRARWRFCLPTPGAPVPHQHAAQHQASGLLAAAAAPAPRLDFWCTSGPSVLPAAVRGTAE